MWLRLVEAYLTTALLRSPVFHRGVGFFHKKVRHLRYGKDPAELGGTNIDKIHDPNSKGFFGHFLDEVKDQLKGHSAKK